MRGNTFGQFFSVTTFGESHGPALGVVIDGCPAGIDLGVEDLAQAMVRRRPGQSALTSPRKEDDIPEILSGIFEGKTLGTPIAVVTRNRDVRSEDYDPNFFRPGHADKVWQDKFGHRDWRGGGRASGRETLSRVIAGVVAEKILPPSVKIIGFTRAVGSIEAQEIPSPLTREKVDEHSTRCPDLKMASQMEKEILAAKEAGDSRGGIVEIWIDGATAGWGEPVFRKLKSELAAAFMSVGATSGVEFGPGFDGSQISGKKFHADPENYGGLLGGLATGDRIVARVAFKPTSAVGTTAKMGRHDPCIIPRAVPVIDAMTALVLADFHLASRLDR